MQRKSEVKSKEKKGKKGKEAIFCSADDTSLDFVQLITFVSEVSGVLEEGKFSWKF